MFEQVPVRGTMLRQIFACVCGKVFCWFCWFVFQLEIVRVSRVFAANLMSLSRGASNAWLTANFLALQRSDTPLPYGPLSLKEASLVISIYYVGSFSGNFMAPFIVRTFGSKRVILCVAFPQIVSLSNSFWRGRNHNEKRSVAGAISTHHFRTKSVLFVCHKYNGRVAERQPGQRHGNVCVRCVWW